MLNDLQLGEFIYEQPAVGDTEYIFKHALTQEVAYNSVLMERRRVLHERTGKRSKAFIETISTIIWRNWRTITAAAEISAKALEYHERAGLQGVRRSVYVEAMQNFTAALEFLERMPPGRDRDRREFALQTSLGPALMATKGWAAPETERAYLRAEAAC